MRLFQRLGSVFEVPTYFVLPVLSTVNRAGFPVAIASMVLLFTVYAGSNAVGSHPATAGAVRKIKYDSRD